MVQRAHHDLHLLRDVAIHQQYRGRGPLCVGTARRDGNRIAGLQLGRGCSQVAQHVGLYGSIQLHQQVIVLPGHRANRAAHEQGVLVIVGEEMVFLHGSRDVVCCDEHYSWRRAWLGCAAWLPHQPTRSKACQQEDEDDTSDGVHNSSYDLIWLGSSTQVRVGGSIQDMHKPFGPH